MSQIRQRSELVQVTDTVQLRALFKDGTGTPIDLDAYPTISIILPSGLVSFGPTSAGIYRVEEGRYGFDYAVGIGGPVGVYIDKWTGTLQGTSIEANFQFIVDNTQMPAINTDGYYHLGDDVGFNYSQNAIFNIDKVIKGLRARLKSSGKAKKIDANGNVTYIDCDIFTTDLLVTFCAMSLSNFNEIPYFTNFTYEDTAIIDQFINMLVQGATLYALSSQALIERGREFNITDNGISFVPPTVSEMLMTQYSSALSSYNENLKYIKNSMRPAPKGLGTMTITTTNPNVQRLRHLRARRFF